MSLSKSKFGKKSYFWTRQTRGQTSGQTGQNTDFVRVQEVKRIHPKGVLGQDKLGTNFDFVHGQTNLNTKSV